MAINVDQLTSTMLLDRAESFRVMTRKELSRQAAASGGDTYPTEDLVDKWVAELYPDYAILEAEGRKRQIWPK